ncbi:methyltransferase domain-containing protein [Saccharopolyspora mangrovi]|uniref:Methyltransferase domain-containing protein n=1 Tax=Saccharopolyspora mangrovi TaxID=3082379 RepID=A0ABU6AF64_9PSEU|nr:methyltransferase domain-containing protein [Saccharopolyspora sp. S2-29]MEB3370177.1 methyltransferase domain-containing protein [Saccharopolyspora sp. S2-29]
MSAQDTYTHGHHESVLRSHRWRTAENSAGYLLDDLRPGAQVLDVGCGPGTITLDFAERVAPGRVLGIDNVEDPLALARSATAERGLDNVEFETADVYRLPFADDSFDVVHAHQVLQHLTDPVAALREMRRVCRPGGVVAARDADYGGMRWSPDHPGMDRWLELYRAVAERNDGHPDGGKRLKSWALQAGFTDIECTASAWCFATPSERAWWGDLWADRIRQSTFATQAIAHGLTTADELETLAAAWHTWRDADQGWFAVLNGEIRCHP